MESFLLLLRYLSATWRYRWYGVAVAWLIGIAGWAVVAIIPDQFVSTVRIYVDTDSMLRPLMKGITVDSNLMSEIEMMQKTLLSRPNLQKVAHATGIDAVANTPAQVEKLLLSLSHRVTLASEGKNLFALRAEGKSPQSAKATVDALLSVFVESNLGATRKDMQSAIRFVGDRVDEYEQKLEQAERRAAEFKEENIGFLPGEQNYFNRLEAAQTEASKTRADIDEKMRKRDELVRQLAVVPQFLEIATVEDSFDMPVGTGPPIGGAADAGPDLHPRMAELQHTLEQLLRRYTPQHPDVVAAWRELNELANQIAAHQKTQKKSVKPNPQVAPVHLPRATVPNPVYEKIKVNISSEESEIASLEARLERQEAEIHKWEQIARRLPGVEAEMVRLNRDYEVIKRNYDELLNRRQAARLAQDLDTQSDKVQFRIIDPPAVPSKPSGPDRLLFLSAVAVAAIAGGLFLAFFLGQIDQSICSVEQLRAAVKLPVLGSVSLVESVRHRRRHVANTLSFAIACVAFVGAVASVLTVDALHSLKIDTSFATDT